MLPESITLIVVTPERKLVHESVHEVQAPAKKGYLGILPGHSPLISELGMGELSFRRGRDVYHLCVIGGYLEVLPDRVIVLAKVAERAEDIDVDRARSASERAKKRLTSPGDPDVDWDRATFALQRSLIRLQVAAHGGAVATALEEGHAAP